MATIAISVLTIVPAEAQDLAAHFAGIQGTFVLLNGQTGHYVRHDPVRAAQRFAPCSTFKIPNTAILLDTGIAPDAEHTLKYDPALKQPTFWARDQSLRSAFQTSAVWYYQAVARQAGLFTATRYLKQFRYGNEDTSGGLNVTGWPFWLDGSLRISANEQVDFLRRFYDGSVGLSERTTRLTKNIMVAEETPRWRLSAKTGACQPTGEEVTMWYVGYVEKQSTVYYFAMQLGDKEYGELFKVRVTKAKDILRDLGILD